MLQIKVIGFDWVLCQPRRSPPGAINDALDPGMNKWEAILASVGSTSDPENSRFSRLLGCPFAFHYNGKASISGPAQQNEHGTG